MSSMSGKFVQPLTVLAMAAIPVLAQGDMPEAPPPGLFGGNFLFIMAAMIAIIYFVMIRPEKRRQQEHQKMMAALKKGDRVMTTSGIMGSISAVRDNSYLISTGDDEVIIEFAKSAILNVINPEGAAGNGGKKELPSAGKGSR